MYTTIVFSINQSICTTHRNFEGCIMNRSFRIIIASIFCAAVISGCGLFSRERSVVIVSPVDASPRERLAAREIRRYVYLRSGRLLDIISDELELPKREDMIVVAEKDRPVMRSIAREAGLNTLLNILTADHYLLKTITRGKQRVLLVTGDGTGTLYAAYRFAENLGVRFYLHGDIIPGNKVVFELTDLNQDDKPLFELRGIQSVYEYPDDPDIWSENDYMAALSQLPKLGMNYFGLYSSGSEKLLFDGDSMTINLFAYARDLGIKTGLGIDMQKAESGRLGEQYADLFVRIGETYNPDYFVMLTPYERGMTVNNPVDIPSILRAAAGVMEDTDVSFTLAAGGVSFWPELDKELNRDIAAVSVTGSHRQSSTDDALGRIYSRDKWVIALPDDSDSTTAPQFQADRIRENASNSLKNECTALIGMVQSESITDLSVLALARAAWDISTYGGELPADTVPSTEYTDSPRLIVPTVRTSIMASEPLRLKVIVLDNEQLSQADLYWRPLGIGEFTPVPLTHVNRGIYSAELSVSVVAGNDIEYYVKAIAADGTEMHFPATAPELNQTVVMF